MELFTLAQRNIGPASKTEPSDDDEKTENEDNDDEYVPTVRPLPTNAPDSVAAVPNRFSNGFVLPPPLPKLDGRSSPRSSSPGETIKIFKTSSVNLRFSSQVNF